jgi:hypothetical protein
MLSHRKTRGLTAALAAASMVAGSSWLAASAAAANASPAHLRGPLPVSDALNAYASSLAPAAARSFPLFTVTREGLVHAQGDAISRAYHIPDALAANGAFSYAAAGQFGHVPQTAVGRGEDKAGRPTVSYALNLAALKSIRVLSDAAARSHAAPLLRLANLGPAFKTSPSISHNTLVLANTHGATMASYRLDTTVSYRISLAGLPVTGQGSRLRVTFAPNGAVTQLSDSQRAVRQGRMVPVITSAQASAECTGLYGPQVKQATPTLGYQFPPLTARRAGGVGTVHTLYPQYTCNPIGPHGAESGRLIPAVQGSAPRAIVSASRDGNVITAAVTALAGGTAPYSYQWSSSSTVLTRPEQGRRSTSYTRVPRLSPAGAPGSNDERVSLQITDANGLVTTVTVDLPGNGAARAASLPGGGGLERFSSVGIEETVDYWQCAEDSANGFNSVMSGSGAAVAFDWRGNNAWEDDFEDPAFGGDDHSWVDNVDMTWYTGHGWPGGFTFAGNNDTTSITPSEISWGDHRVDWVDLESCDVLADTSGTNDYFGRWGPTMDGLHILNGFATSAYCISGGTGGDFASYLFPATFLWWTTRPAFTIQQAWAAMAVDKEPSAVTYRSMGPITFDNNGHMITDINDHWWGQGPVGPDIFAGSVRGYWSISGTV